jgi:hypothetical protein
MEKANCKIVFFENASELVSYGLMVYHIFSKVKIDKYLFKYLFKSKD